VRDWFRKEEEVEKRDDCKPHKATRVVAK